MAKKEETTGIQKQRNMWRKRWLQALLILQLKLTASRKMIRNCLSWPKSEIGFGIRAG